jgi:hypothetical protein
VRRRRRADGNRVALPQRADRRPLVFFSSFFREASMKRHVALAAAAVALCVGVAVAQQFPMLDRIADKVVQKYQSSSCEQLMQKRGQPKAPEEQKIVGMLKNDQAMRTEFINRVAAPIANKMFDCGMIP